MRGEYRYAMTATFDLDASEHFERPKQYTRTIRYRVERISVTVRYPTHALDRLYFTLSGPRQTKDGDGQIVTETHVTEDYLPESIKDVIAAKVIEWQASL